jgi:hypothetical protein
MVAHILPIAAEHAAEILRPRTVQGRIDNDVTGGVAGADFLRLGRETEELPIGEEIQRPQRRIVDPINVLAVQADAGSHHDQQRWRNRCEADALAFEIGDPANARAREQLVAAGVQARDDGDRDACAKALICVTAELIVKSNSPRPSASSSNAS